MLWWLQALDHLSCNGAGWNADCPCCGAWLHVDEDERIECSDGCTEAEVRDYLALPQRLNGNSAYKALVLSKDLETFVALMDGQSVPRSRLDPVWKRRFGVD